MARPREFDQNTVLEAAMELFWSRGYEATSLPDLLEVMGLSRSSFYQCFESKEALFQRCLQLYGDVVVATKAEGLVHASSGRAFLEEQIRGIALEAEEDSRRWGCFLANSAHEFGQRHRPIAKLVSSGTKRLEQLFRAALEKAQAAGEIGSDKNVPVLARYLVSSACGLRTLVKAGSSAQEVEEVAEQVLLALG